MMVLSTGPALRPTYQDNPLKYRAGRNGSIFIGPYILPNKKIFDPENKDSPSKQMWM